MASLIGFSPELRKQSLLPVYPILVLFAWQCAAQLLRRKTQAINAGGSVFLRVGVNSFFC
jgi:hypothetical protein